MPARFDYDPSERRPRRATVSVQLDESEFPTTMHDVARIILTCQDSPLAADAIETQAPFCEIEPRRPSTLNPRKD